MEWQRPACNKQLMKYYFTVSELPPLQILLPPNNIIKKCRSKSHSWHIISLKRKMLISPNTKILEPKEGKKKRKRKKW